MNLWALLAKTAGVHKNMQLQRLHFPLNILTIPEMPLDLLGKKVMNVEQSKTGIMLLYVFLH